MLPQRHTIPPHVEAAVLTALEKLPADRFATAAEFSEALAGRNYVPTVPSAAAAPAPAAAVGRRRRDPVTLALGGVAAVAIAAALWGWLRPTPAPTVNRFSLFLPPEQALQPVTTSGNRLAISPDGKRMVYIGPAERGGRLWLRELDQLNSTPITGTEGAGTPFFSPDGRHIGFLINGTTLRTVSLDGGPVLTLSDSVNSTGGTWGPDGYIYVEGDSGILRMRSSGGAAEVVYNALARKEVGAEWPVLLPDASGLVFRTRRANQAAADFQIVAMKLPHGEPKVLMRGVYARYSPTGHLLVATAEGKLLAVPFDPEKLEATGSPIGLLEGLGVEGSGFSINLALSENGTLVYTTGGATGSRRPVWVSRDGAESPVDPAWQPQGIIANFALSPDGKALAVDVVQNGVNTVWVKQLPAGPYSRLTFGDTGSMRPTWSADGRSVVYLTEVNTTGGKPVMRRADGTGNTRTLLPVRPVWGQAFQTRDAPLAGAQELDLRAGQGQHLRRADGRHHAGAARGGPSDGGRRGGLAGRALAGVHVGGVGGVRDLRASLPRRRVGALAGLGRGGHRSGVVAQRAGAVLSQRAERDDERPGPAGGGVLVQPAQAALLDRAVFAGPAGAVVRRESGRQAVPDASGDDADGPERADRGAELGGGDEGAGGEIGGGILAVGSLLASSNASPR